MWHFLVPTKYDNITVRVVYLGVLRCQSVRDIYLLSATYLILICSFSSLKVGLCSLMRFWVTRFLITMRNLGCLCCCSGGGTLSLTPRQTSRLSCSNQATPNLIRLASNQSNCRTYHTTALQRLSVVILFARVTPHCKARETSDIVSLVGSSST